MKDLNKVVGETIKAQIGGNKDNGWGQKDSMVVILETIHADVENAVERKEDMAKYTVSETAEGLINDFVNPSAARQKLESAGLLNKNAKTERKKTMWAELAK